MKYLFVGGPLHGEYREVDCREVFAYDSRAVLYTPFTDDHFYEKFRVKTQRYIRTFYRERTRIYYRRILQRTVAVFILDSIAEDHRDSYVTDALDGSDFDWANGLTETITLESELYHRDDTDDTDDTTCIHCDKIAVPSTRH